MTIPAYNLTYNGVSLDIIHPEIIARDHIYSEDGTTYLYTRWTFDGIFVYNPSASSFDDRGGGRAGFLPAQSDVNIREDLRTQRASLIWSFGNDALLDTDGIDARNGPIVERCNIIRTIGVKTFYVDFRVVTFVNECNTQQLIGSAALNPTDPTKALLSHRWKRMETVDQDYYSVIVTEGHCVFRSDVLQMLTDLQPGLPTQWPAFPDQWRRDLFHPIPRMFKRGPIEIIPGEDGVTYDYRFVDHQLPFRGPNDQTCTRVEAFHTSWVAAPSLSDRIGSGLTLGITLKNLLPQAAIGVAAGAAAGAPLGPGGAGAGAVLGLGFAVGLESAQAGLQFANAILPRFRQHIIVRAWGHSGSTRSRLTNLAIKVVLGALGGKKQLFAGHEFFISQELSGKFVQVEFTQTFGIENAIIVANQFVADVNAAVQAGNIGQVVDAITDAVGNTVTGFATVEAAFAPVQKHDENCPFNDPPQANFQGVIINGASLDDLSPIPPPPNGDGSRGTWLGTILAQALSGQCETPPEPPSLPNTAIPQLNSPALTIVQERSL